MIAMKIAAVANSRFQKLTSNRPAAGPDPDQIKDEGDQGHCDHKVHHDRMDRVHPGQVAIVELGQQLEHGRG